MLSDTEEDDEESAAEPRRARPFFLREAMPTERLIPDATSGLNSSVLFPTDAFAGLRQPEKSIQLGDFAISSRLAVAATYDDNTDASKSDRKDDITTNLLGSVQADSIYKRHSLGFELSAAIDEVK
jgi:hypothetical protein